MHNLSLDISFTSLFDLLGTFAFAISGIRLASLKKVDWFGAYIVGLVTAIGGGTIRDLLLDVPLFWMQTPVYLITTAIALGITILFRKSFFRWGNTLMMFDTIGLGLFTIVGITKSVEAGFPFWVCIMMGTITGSVGGVIRDVLMNEIPLVFKKDIYALACIIGGVAYFICRYFQFAEPVNELIASLTVIVIRFVAIKFHLHLPILSATDENSEFKK